MTTYDASINFRTPDWAKAFDEAYKVGSDTEIARQGSVRADKEFAEKLRNNAFANNISTKQEARAQTTADATEAERMRNKKVFDASAERAGLDPETLQPPKNGAAADDGANGGSSLSLSETRAKVEASNPGTADAIDKKFSTDADRAAYYALVLLERPKGKDDPNNSHYGPFQISEARLTAAGLTPTDAQDPVKALNEVASINAGYAKQFMKATGKQPTAQDIYMMHQQGAGGYIAMVKNPNARVGDLVGDSHIKRNNGNPNMTAQAFTDSMGGRYTALLPSTGGTADGVTVTPSDIRPPSVVAGAAPGSYGNEDRGGLTPPAATAAAGDGRPVATPLGGQAPRMVLKSPVAAGMVPVTQQGAVSVKNNPDGTVTTTPIMPMRGNQTAPPSLNVPAPAPSRPMRPEYQPPDTGVIAPPLADSYNTGMPLP